MTIVKYTGKPDKRYYPKGDIVRRGIALSIDFLGVWLISSFLGSGNIGVQFVQIIVFIVLWIVWRVLVPYNNLGQSLGRWAVNLKILEVNQGEIVNRIPDLPSLVKREAVLCFCTLLVSICLSNLLDNPTAILLLLPLVIDCGAALSDAQKYQAAIHDRYAKTVIVSSRRGYSLDLKIRRLVGSFRQNVRR
jgi:uncharacterized RDD family membrane protein YckC